jgi:hypothetical protein
VDGEIRRVAGIYDDEFARIHGAWRFSRRVFTSLIDHSA